MREGSRPPPLSVPSLNERLGGSDPVSPAMPTEAIERAAYAALGLPHPRDVPASGELFHHLGSLKIGESEAALEAAVACFQAHPSSEAHNRFYDYAEYLFAVRSHSSLQSRYRSDEKAIATYRHLPFERSVFRPTPEHSTTDIDQQFLHAFKRSVFTPDLSGYRAYLKTMIAPLSHLFEKPLPVYFPEKPRLTHSYLIGTTGSGKTELMKCLIHSYVTQPKSAAVVVLDPAGDFAKQIMQWPEFNVGNRLIYVRHDLKSGHVPILNPFDLAGTEALATTRAAVIKKRQVAQELLEALAVIIGSGTGAEFSLNMERILLPCILALLDRPGSTLLDLERFMNDEANADLVQFAAGRTHHGQVMRVFEGEFFDPRFKPTKDAIKTKFGSLFATGFLVEMTCGKSTFNLEAALNQRRVIVFDLSKGRLGEGESVALGRFIIAVLQAIAKRRDEIPEHERVPVHAFVDECHNYICDTVKEILRESRKYKLFMTLAQQNVGQDMNREMRAAVVGLSNVKACGKVEPDQRERAARQIDVSPEVIRELNVGEGAFYIRFGAHSPFKMQARADLLGYRHRMAKSSVRALIQRQLRAYYRPVDDPLETRSERCTPGEGPLFDEFE